MSEDRTPEQLKAENVRLRVVLGHIDREMDRAAAKYLNSTVPRGHLRFQQFVNLLVLEVRRSIRLDLKEERESKLKVAMRGLIEAKIDERMMSLLPLMQAGIAKFVTIQVLIKAVEDPAIPYRKGAGPTKYRAIPLRGTSKYGHGGTAEDAYSKVRENLAIGLLKASESRGEMVKFLTHEREEFFYKYAQATPFRSDEIDGFKIESRLEGCSHA